MKQKLIEIKGEIDKTIIMVGLQYYQYIGRTSTKKIRTQNN